jgi:S1-C subfamily serine protease
MIVTAYHVIQNAEHIKVFDASFRQLSGVSVLHIDAATDIAVLQSQDAVGIASLRLAAAPPSAESEVRVVGNFLGLSKQILFGRLTSNGTVPSKSLSSVDGNRIFAQDIPIYPLDVTIYNGMSGAPVIAPDDSVIGVLSGSMDKGRGIAWAIPSNDIGDLLKSPVLGQPPGTMPLWPALSLMQEGG